jgi:hypothetical protein
MNNKDNYVNLTALGKLYNAGPRDVGNWLKEMGLRDQDGRPSQKAIKEEFVKERVTEWGPQWLWNLAKTRNAIDGRRPPDAVYGDGFVLYRGS